MDATDGLRASLGGMSFEDQERAIQPSIPPGAWTPGLQMKPATGSSRQTDFQLPPGSLHSPVQMEGGAPPAKQALRFWGTSAEVNLPSPSAEKTTYKMWGAMLANVQLSGGSLKDMTLVYEKGELKSGKCKVRISNPTGVKLTSNLIDCTIDKEGDVTQQPLTTTVTFENWGTATVTGITMDRGGFAFSAELTPGSMGDFKSKIPGGGLESGSIKISRANGKLSVGGNGSYFVNSNGKRLLGGTFTATTSPTGKVEAKLTATFGSTLPLLSTITLSGKYADDPETGKLSVTLGAKLSANIFQNSSEKLTFAGEGEVNFSTADGLTFGGGFALHFKPHDTLEASGSVTVEYAATGPGAEPEWVFKASLSGKGELKNGTKATVSGSVVFGATTGHYVFTGSVELELFKDWKVKLAVTKRSFTGEGQLPVEIAGSVSKDSIPFAGTKFGDEKDFTKRMTPIPLAGPLVLEGGFNGGGSFGAGPARLDNFIASAKLNPVDWTLMEAKLGGSLVLPLHAQIKAGLFLGLGVDVVLASAGAGVKGDLVAGVIEGSGDQNAIVANVEADLVSNQANQETGRSLKAELDKTSFEVAVEFMGSVYARYATAFSDDKFHTHPFARVPLLAYGPIGLKGTAQWTEKKGFSVEGADLVPPALNTDAAADWISEKFAFVRGWFKDGWLGKPGDALGNALFDALNDNDYTDLPEGQVVEKNLPEEDRKDIEEANWLARHKEAVIRATQGSDKEPISHGIINKVLKTLANRGRGGDRDAERRIVRGWRTTVEIFGKTKGKLLSAEALKWYDTNRPTLLSSGIMQAGHIDQMFDWFSSSKISTVSIHLNMALLRLEWAKTQLSRHLQAQTPEGQKLAAERIAWLDSKEDRIVNVLRLVSKDDLERIKAQVRLRPNVVEEKFHWIQKHVEKAEWANKTELAASFITQWGVDGDLRHAQCGVLHEHIVSIELSRATSGPRTRSDRLHADYWVQSQTNLCFGPDAAAAIQASGVKLANEISPAMAAREYTHYLYSPENPAHLRLRTGDWVSVRVSSQIEEAYAGVIVIAEGWDHKDWLKLWDCTPLTDYIKQNHSEITSVQTDSKYWIIE